VRVNQQVEDIMSQSYIEQAKQEFSVVFGRAANMTTADADWVKRYAQILKTGFKSNRPEQGGGIDRR
jgi:hypothetical protein